MNRERGAIVTPREGGDGRRADNGKAPGKKQPGKQTVLVTGGSGFLGRWVVDELLAAGHRVRVLARGRAPALEERG
ncbi:MAG TPA: NAD-dependent epimerase/dehydratase family protein, partial [Polyangia bacterium]